MPYFPCLDCGCNGFVGVVPIGSVGTVPISGPVLNGTTAFLRGGSSIDHTHALPPSDEALQAAVRHLAGLGKGTYHTAKVLPAGVELDGVALRGLREYAVKNQVGGPMLLTLTMIVDLIE